MAQAVKQLQIVNQNIWSKVFPAESSVGDSLLFIKNLTNLAIPTILFIRKILPESEFENKVFEGMTLKVLKNGTRNASTDRILTWLSGAYDALEKNYLKSMSMEIKDTQSNLTLEIYTINIMDNRKRACMSVSTLPGQRKSFSFREQISDTQLQTVRLLQTCYSITKSCSDLPAEVTIFMKLSYQENVPFDYHPFGYKPYIPAMPIFLKKTRTFEVGLVNTNHHVIEFMNKTCLCDESILPKTRKDKSLDEESKETESPGFFSSSTDKLKLQKYNCISSENTSQSVDSQNSKDDEDSKEISSQRTDDFSQSDSVRCPCLSKIKTSVMYQCSGCNYWVHAECFGIRLKTVLNAVNIFYCQICSKLNEDYDCPDVLMKQLNRASEQQKLAVKRRLLSFCNRYEGQEITFRKLEKISGLACQKTVLEKVVKDLTGISVLIRQSEGIYKIVKKKVDEVMSKLFNTGSISSRPVPIHKPEQKTPQLGKRKLENNNQSDRKLKNTQKEMSIMKTTSKKYLR